MCGVDRWGGKRHSSLAYIYICVWVCGVCMYKYKCEFCVHRICLVRLLLLTLARRRSHVVKLARRLTLSRTRSRLCPTTPHQPSSRHLGHCQQPKNLSTIFIANSHVYVMGSWQGHYLELRRLVQHLSPFCFVFCFSSSLSLKQFWRSLIKAIAEVTFSSRLFVFWLSSEYTSTARAAVDV